MRKVIPLLTLAGFIAACGDGPTNSGDTLTQQQAEELAGVVIEYGFAGFGGVANAAQGGGAMQSISYDVDDSGPCPDGGTVALKGSINIDVSANQTDATLGYDYTITHNSCKATGENGTVFTLSGDPNVKATGTMNFHQDTGIDGSLNYDGGVSWMAEGMSGTCAMDLSANFDFSAAGTGSATVSGNVCGISINRSVTVSA